MTPGVFIVRKIRAHKWKTMTVDVQHDAFGVTDHTCDLMLTVGESRRKPEVNVRRLEENF